MATCCCPYCAHSIPQPERHEVPGLYGSPTPCPVCGWDVVWAWSKAMLVAHRYYAYTPSPQNTSKIDVDYRVDSRGFGKPYIGVLTCSTQSRLIPAQYDHARPSA